MYSRAYVEITNICNMRCSFCHGHSRKKKQLTREEFAQAVRNLYLNEIVPCVSRGLCAAIYTQVSDVEDETNGLRTYDRKVEKVTPEEMLPVAEALRRAMEETT